MTPTTAAPRRHGRAEPTPRLRADADLYAALTRRLTPRDRLLLRTLQEHRVLTTTQIQQLAFGTYSAAAQRLRTLHRLRAVDRFRPFTTTGSAPCHYVLDELGAWALAAETGQTPADMGYRRERALAIAHSAKLVHTVGVNGFFTALTATASQHEGCELLAWWSEVRCAREWGDICCPDGYGRWRQGGRECDFFLEYDTGTEPLPRLAAKLAAYAELATITGITTPVLFALPSQRRETNLQQRITHPPVPALTAVISDGTSPAQTAWRPLGPRGSVPLIDIAATQTETPK